MAENRRKEDLEEFLRKVSELEAVVKGNAPPDLSEKTGVNRTVITKDAFNTDTRMGAAVTAEQNSFMKSIEADAAERAARRKARTKIALGLKDEGNKAFKRGDYVEAIALYTEGLAQVKDMTVLYTNRAQAYIQLEKYTEAISDCETVLMLDPALTKAYISKGRALVGQKQFEQAINTYMEAVKHNPKQQKIVNEYIRQAEQAREANSAETNAQRVFLAGDDHASNMVNVLEKLRKEGQPTVYYGGGLAILADMMNDDVTRTLFRTNNGLNIFAENRTISSGIAKVLNGSKGVVELELVMSSIDVMDRSIADNDENLSRLLRFPTFPDTAIGLLGCLSESVAQKALTLLLKISYRPSGLKGILSHFDIQRLLFALLTFVQTRNSGASECIKLLNNLATEDKFTQHFRDSVEDKILPSFENLLANHSTLPVDILSSCLSFLGNTLHDPVVRRRVQDRAELLASASNILECHCETSSKSSSQGVLVSLLGLFINITIDGSLSRDQSEKLAPSVTSLFDCDDHVVVERALTLYSKLIPQSPPVIIQLAEENNIAGKLTSFIRDGRSDLFKGCVRVLALLTQGSTKIREEIVSNKKDLERICSLLDQEDDTTVANTALILTHCFDVKQSATILEGTDIVKTLLGKTDTNNPTIKQNTAIALAKLSMGNQRHLERLRELGGIGILHSCMKHVN